MGFGDLLLEKPQSHLRAASEDLNNNSWRYHASYGGCFYLRNLHVSLHFGLPLCTLSFCLIITRQVGSWFDLEIILGNRSVLVASFVSVVRMEVCKLDRSSVREIKKKLPHTFKLFKVFTSMFSLLGHMGWIFVCMCTAQDSDCQKMFCTLLTGTRVRYCSPLSLSLLHFRKNFNLQTGIHVCVVI